MWWPQLLLGLADLVQFIGHDLQKGQLSLVELFPRRGLKFRAALLHLGVGQFHQGQTLLLCLFGREAGGEGNPDTRTGELHQGFALIGLQDGLQLLATEVARMSATRLEPDHPWVRWAESSLAETSGKDVVLLPNLGGSLPNRAFAHVLGLPTIWVPHSYPGCAQHAPNEHQLASLSREAMGIMAGLFWDLGEENIPA